MSIITKNFSQCGRSVQRALPTLLACILLLFLTLAASAQGPQRNHRPLIPPAFLQPLPGMAPLASALLPPLQPGNNALAGDILIGLDKDADETRFREQIQQLGQLVGYSRHLHVYHVLLNPGVSDALAIAWLRQQTDVTFAHNNHRIQIAATVVTPNDANYNLQWNLPQVKADQVWGQWKPQGQVVLAIVDTGVDYTHPDLANMMFTDTFGGVIGHDATGNNSFLDGYGHGTHCAGIAAAQSNNGVSYTNPNNGYQFGIAGAVGWNGAAGTTDTSHIKIMPVRVLDSTGSGSDATVSEGIEWAADHGAQVISMSLGEPEDPNNPGPPAAVDAAVQYAWKKGVVIVAAAGNDGSTEHFYPAACSHVISVAATDSTDTLASFSNYGSWVNVAAPGVNVFSTFPTYAASAGWGTYYGYLSGTSMATPHVAAEAALLLGQKLTLTNAQVHDAIIANVDAIQGTNTISNGNGGRINFLSALNAAAPSGSAFGYQVNCGGSAAGTFTADNYYNSGGLTYSTSSSIDTSGVTNAAPQACYQSVRYSYSPLSYTLPNLTAGASYKVRLHFAEISFNSAGMRVFNGSINGTQVLSNFDVYATAGAKNKAIVEEFTTTADSNGYITILLTPITNCPDPCAIEIIANGSTTVSGYQVNCGGAAAGTFTADNYYNSGGLTYSTSSSIDTSGVTNAAPQACYQSVRYSYSPLSYTLPNLTAGASYKVRLHFAEISFNSAGMRVFNGSINGTQVLSNFDVYATAGAKNKAIVEEFTTTADSNGYITILLTPITNCPDPCAIEIIANGSTTVPTAPTALTTTAGNAQVTLNWTAPSSGATSYNIKRGTSLSGAFTTIATLQNVVTYTDSGTNYDGSNKLTNGATFYYVVTAMNNVGESVTSNTASAMPSKSTVKYQINCGGSAAGTFTADNYYNSGGLTYSTSSSIDTSGVTNAAPQACYQSVRYSYSPLSYTLPNLTAGASYKVRLHFAEISFNSAGMRVFNGSINGTQVLSNFDVYATAGAKNKAIVEEFTTTADSNGYITILLTPITNCPDPCAIEIIAP